MPPDIACMVGLLVKTTSGVAVEDRPTEGGVLDRVAIGANGQVTAGEHPLELAGSGLAEDRAGVLVKATRIVLHLLLKTLVAILGGHALKDLQDHLLLVSIVELADRGGLGINDEPVVVDHRALCMVEGHADQLALVVLQAVEELLDHRLGRLDLLRLSVIRQELSSRPKRQAGCANGRSRGGGGTQKMTTAHIVTIGTRQLARNIFFPHCDLSLFLQVGYYKVSCSRRSWYPKG